MNDHFFLRLGQSLFLQLWSHLCPRHNSTFSFPPFGRECDLGTYLRLVELVELIDFPLILLALLKDELDCTVFLYHHFACEQIK
jgi:hypothetical protein